MGSANFYYSPLVEQGSQEVPGTNRGTYIYISLDILLIFLSHNCNANKTTEPGEQSNTGNLCFGSGLDPDLIWSVDSDPGGKNEPQK